MVKVNRKIGAVAVYSPFRAGAIVLLTALLLLAGGFGIAQLADGDEDGSVATAQTGGPTSDAGATQARAQLAAAEARTDRAQARLRKVRAQRRKYALRIRRMRSSRKTADAGSARLATGTPYIVILRKGSGGADYVIGPRSPMRRGMSYRRCPDGVGICARSDGS